MDPERARAYLQVACAGLGFDIGEIWWTSTDNGSSTVAAIADHPSDPGGQMVDSKRPRFVQLYTSKSYENRRSDLVNPPDSDGTPGLRRSNSSENLEKHVLSPRLVNAISDTAQVVWANTMKQEGLIGRSDIRLQTAVGMPVAIDSNGNMCVVVMFSPQVIPNTDDAMDYLQSISKSATSSAIPCLLPVFDPQTTGLRQLLPADHQAVVPHVETNSLGEGVVAHFVSFEDGGAANDALVTSAEALPHRDHELWTAPKDTFGIPMLPSFAELNNVNPEETIDVFDEASYGVWTTIMENLADGAQEFDDDQNFDLQQDLQNGTECALIESSNGVTKESLLNTTMMPASRRERLEEFCNAFLGMSVFDLADVWIPAGSDALQHVTSVRSTENNSVLNNFQDESRAKTIKIWNGAVGRAFSSGNPVWSANPRVFVDAGRASAMQQANIATVMAVPVFSNKFAVPACVVCFYSLVRSGSVPFVLRFVQQALRLLWDGLDNVEPHESVGTKLWRNVAPADLGEMAADVEMQQHFLTKKRPRSSVSDAEPREDVQISRNLAAQLQTITLPNGDTVSVPLQLTEDVDSSPAEVKLEDIHSHVHDAVRSIGNAIVFDRAVANSDGTKRAHVMGPISRSGHSPLPPPQGLPTQIFGSSGVSFDLGQSNKPSMSLAAVSAAQRQQQSYNGIQLHQDPFKNLVSMPQPMHNFDSSDQLCAPCAPETKTSAKLCRIQGCDDPALSRRPYCVKHSGSRLCEHEGCGKCAQGSTRFCIAHGGGRRCTFPGCDKGARDKFFCAAHGGGKRCKHDGCSKSAVGGSQLCTAHGGGRRCSIEGCDKSAQSSTKYCVKHGGGKKCSQEGCTKVARGRTLFCASHGGGVRCKLDGCNRVAIGKMQLCRAHGGGSGAKSDSSLRSMEPPQGHGALNPSFVPMAVDYMASV